MSHSPCPYCGQQPVESLDWCNHKVLACPDGHRKSSALNWDTTNAVYLKQFNKVLNTITTMSNGGNNENPVEQRHAS